MPQLPRERGDLQSKGDLRTYRRNFAIARANITVCDERVGIATSDVTSLANRCGR